MLVRKHSGDVYLTLKASVRQLVKKLGGLRAASEVSRCSHAMLGFYGDANHDRHIPLDVIADLEAENGDPVITRELARLHGMDLVPIDRRRDVLPTQDPATMIASILPLFSDFGQSVVEMDADGRREPHEVDACIREINELIDGAEKCRQDLYRHKARLMRHDEGRV